MITGATVALVPSPKAVALAVLGYPGMPEAADAVPGLLPHQPVAIEGMDARLVDVFRARRGDAAVPDLPRGESWLFVETAGDTEAEARAAAARLIADAGCLDSLVVTGAPARALWRVREDGAGLGSRTPAGAPAWPGWEDAAVPPEHLGAYLRDFAALMTEHRLDGLSLRALRRRLRAHPHRLPVLVRAGPLPRVRRRRGATGGQVRRLDVRRARRRPGPQRAAARHVLGRGHRRHGRGQGDLRPGQRAQPRRAGRPGAAGRGPARAAGPAAAHRARLRLLPRRRRPVRRGAPLRRAWASAGPTRPAAAASCARPTWPPGTRRTPPAAARGCCRSSPTAPGQGFALGRGGRVAGPVPVLQGLLVRLPGRGGHGHLQGRGAVPAVPAPAAPAGPLLAGLAAPLGPAGLARARAGQRRAARPGPGRPGQAAGRDRRPAAAAAVRRADLPRLVRRPARRRRRRAARRCCCGWTRSPTTSPPRSARPPCGCSRRPGTRCRSPASRCAAG